MSDEILETAVPNEDETEKEELVEKPEESDDDSDKDYRELIERDLNSLRESIPELHSLKDISELENPVRYGALRDLGLSPEEAYRATTTRTRVVKTDNRSHLKSSLPKLAASPTQNISYRDLEAARAIFTGVSDAEIQRLFRKVTR